jgi:nitroimidazol reductase NimA-like FMN-containing flavoprotein (pyridoxamine 5'-phosphate oxidase superfamily)
MTGDLAVLEPAECWALLRSQCVGRLAFTERALPAIRPLNYAVTGNHLMLHVGADLARRLDGQVVAFEVDDIDSTLKRGVSVVITGTLRWVRNDGELLRTLGLPPSWAGPGHQEAVCLTVGDLQGRRLPARPLAV